MGDREDGDFTLGTYLVCLCGPGVQERAKVWVYGFGCHKNGTDQGECMESGSSDLYFEREELCQSVNYELSPRRKCEFFP